MKGVRIMRVKVAIGLTLAMTLAACSTAETSPGLAGQRSVFHNPYAPVVIDHGPVGPDQCSACPGGVWVDGVFYPGRGAYAYDRFGTRILLTRQERRQARERYRQVSALIEQNRAIEQFNAAQAGASPPPPPPMPSAPPTTAGSPPAENSSGNGSGRGSAPPPISIPESREPF